MTKETFAPKIPKEYSSLKRMVLVPSYTILRSIKESLKSKGLSLRNGPLLADCFSPLLLDSHTMILGPFLGSSGISYLLHLLLPANEKAEVLFFGSAARIISNTIEENKKLYQAGVFYTELESGLISHVAGEHGKKNMEIVLSTHTPQYESLETIVLIHTQYHVSLIDMESAFIKKTCAQFHVHFEACFICSDIWDLQDRSHYMRKSLSKLPEFESLIEHASFRLLTVSP
jgi:hypothetical protein